MDWQQILEAVPYWPFVTVIIVLCVVFIFRKELGKQIGKLQLLEFDTETRRLRLLFGEEVKNAKARAQAVEREVADSRILPVADRATDFAKQSGRDIVLQSCSALKQAVYDACLANNVPLTPTTRINEALHRLREAKVMNPDLEGVINLLNKLGAEVANYKKFRPTESDALQYKDVAHDVIDWIMLNLIARTTTKEPTVSEAPLRRPTVVGDYFPKPQPGRPAAVLDGIGGVAQAKRFPIDKEYFRIGRDSDNDLSISGDQFVSGHHASLRYQTGSLLLGDDGSRNGTFLNEKRVTGSVVIVHRCDQIRVGNAIFRVSEAPPSHAVNKDKHPKQSEFVG